MERIYRCVLDDTVGEVVYDYRTLRSDATDLWACICKISPYNEVGYVTTDVVRDRSKVIVAWPFEIAATLGTIIGTGYRLYGSEVAEYAVITAICTDWFVVDICDTLSDALWQSALMAIRNPERVSHLFDDLPNIVRNMGYEVADPVQSLLDALIDN